MTGQKSGFESN